MSITHRLVTLALAGACLAYAGKVHNDFDPAVDYTKFKTFSFVAGIDMGKTGIMDDPQKRMRIANFVSGILETHKLKEIPRDQKHDLAVRVWVAVRQRQEVTSYSFSTGYWGGYSPYWYGPWGSYYETYVVNDFVEGTLIIDLLDPTTKELVWRTYLRDKFEDPTKDYAEAKKHLNKAFDEFPPTPQAKEKKRKEREKAAQKDK
jgi:hypothetical protein